MGKFHASKLAAIPEIKFVGCHDLDPEKARTIADSIAARSLPNPLIF